MRPAAWAMLAVAALGTVLIVRTLRGDGAVPGAALPSAALGPLDLPGAVTGAEDLAFLESISGGSLGGGSGGSGGEGLSGQDILDALDGSGTVSGSGSGGDGSGSSGGVTVVVCGGGQILTPDGQCVSDPGL